MRTSPTQLFRIAAVAEAVSWTGLLIGMVFKYLVVFNEIGVTVFGPIHGALFLVYLTLAVLLWRRRARAPPAPGGAGVWGGAAVRDRGVRTLGQPYRSVGPRRSAGGLSRVGPAGFRARRDPDRALAGRAVSPRSGAVE